MGMVEGDRCCTTQPRSDRAGALVVESFDPTHPVYRSYRLVVRISVEASDEDEARLQVERLLAGRFDFDFVAAIEAKGWAS